MEEAEACLPCPNGGTTKYTRTKSLDQCQSPCPAGQTSLTGYAPCDPCPRGSFQPANASTHCLPCPYGMHTLNTGTSDEADCKYFDIPVLSHPEGALISLNGQSM